MFPPGRHGEAQETCTRIECFRKLGIPSLEMVVADPAKNIVYMTDLRKEGYRLIGKEDEMRSVLLLDNAEDILFGFSADLGKINNAGYAMGHAVHPRIEEAHPTRTLWVVRVDTAANIGERVLTDVANLAYFNDHLSGREKDAGIKLYRDWQGIGENIYGIPPELDLV